MSTNFCQTVWRHIPHDKRQASLWQPQIIRNGYLASEVHKIRTTTAQSIQTTGYRLDGHYFNSRQVQEPFHYSTAYKPVLGSTQPQNQWVPVVPSPGDKVETILQQPQRNTGTAWTLNQLWSSHSRRFVPQLRCWHARNRLSHLINRSEPH
jgi:hypothetical protein